MKRSQHDSAFGRAQRACEVLGLRLSSCRVGLGIASSMHRFRLNYIGAREATAYYTNDLDEALRVADTMRKFVGRRL